MTLDTDMQAVAERMAENSHLLNAKAILERLTNSGKTTLCNFLSNETLLGDYMPLSLVPWDLLTDIERRKDRFRAQEVIKFLQYHGFKFQRSAVVSETFLLSPNTLSFFHSFPSNRFGVGTVTQKHPKLVDITAMRTSRSFLGSFAL